MLFYFVCKMFKVVLFFWLFTSATATSGSADILEALGFIEPVFRTREKLNLNQLSFPILDNYQVNAKRSKEKEYPWIARVVHSRYADIPHMCTAICISEAIFITAARCLYNLKVTYTSVLYKSERFLSRAFVFPSKPTLQMFDDVGFIVVNTKTAQRMQWEVAKLYKMVNRTDEVFKWFSKISDSKKIKYKVVGYTCSKSHTGYNVANKKFYLTELDLPVVNTEICTNILDNNRNNYNYTVPCYHSCTYAQFKEKSKKCKDYHGVEGGALLDATSNRLIGIATWGANYFEGEMPVGFTTLNSDNFFEDYSCSKRIQKDDGSLITKGYYQSLCDEK